MAGNDFGSGGTAFFNGTTVRTNGSGSPLVFTVPYGASVGSHNVHVEVSSRASNTMAFQVTATVAAPLPVAQGYETGYYSVGSSASEDHMELVIFGTGFDTNCRIVFDGNEVAASFTPGIPTGSLFGLFGGGATMPGLPAAHYDKVCAAILSKQAANVPALGSTHTAAVTNIVTNAVSNTVTVSVPARRVLVEIDTLAGASWPPTAVWRNNAVNTLRRSYTSAGILADARMSQDAVPDPLAGAPFTDADVLGFDQSTRNLAGSAFPGEWYFHVSIVSEYDEPMPGFVTTGRMFDHADRQAMVIFSNSVPSASAFLRTLMHEMGHGFNLTHCEGDAIPERDANGDVVRVGGIVEYQTLGTTLMNTLDGSATGWTYEFSAASQTHLTAHPLNEVRPGAGTMAFNSTNRQEGSCDR